MIINKKNFTCSDQYLKARGLTPETCVFFDIETTGFRASSSHLYLIGAAFYSPKGSVSSWTTIQWLAESPQEERELLRAFADFLGTYDTLLHFNGNRFDLPYLKEKYTLCQLTSPFSGMASVDLYQEFRPLKHLLKLERMNQKALERFLGLNREDIYDGGKLIPVYHKYCQTGSKDFLRLLLLHNAEDVEGMFTLTSLYSYLDFVRDNRFHPTVQLIAAKSGKKELLFTFPLRIPVPVPISSGNPYGYLTLKESTGKLLVPMLQDTLYFYFSDYKNYCYLPQEDQAIHKSVASYVDKAYRQPARAENCYIKKQGEFLPQPEEFFTPAFRTGYRDPLYWFPYEEHLLEDADWLSSYLSLLLRNVI